MNAAGCGSAMKEYGHWLPEDAARLFSARVRDVSEVLADADLPLRALPAQTVTYHDACHLAHGQRVRAQPRELLRRIPGLVLVELATPSSAAGARGSTICSSPRWRASSAAGSSPASAETGARVVAAGNPGCLMQIASTAGSAVWTSRSCTR